MRVGGVSFTAPTKVRFDNTNVFEPDVLYIKPDNLAIMQQDERRLTNAPDLIVEVLSTGTAKKDHEHFRHDFCDCTLQLE